jgi:hypothetical protein
LSNPEDYDCAFQALLAACARAATELDARITPFWPLVGNRYNGDLMVIGRSVNGWIDDWAIGELRDPMTRVKVARTMRADAEPLDRCRMLWVTDLAGKTDSPYNTNRSAFWRVLREITGILTGATGATWPSQLAWTNLYKASPAAGWNPGADFQVAQREEAIDLLRRELDSLQPQRVLALTGANWIGPFIKPLGMELGWRAGGLVEGVGRRGSAEVVVARHPMTKPHRQFVDEVLLAFGS